MTSFWYENNEERAAAWASIQKTLYVRGLLTDSEADNAAWEIDFVRSVVRDAPAQMKACDTLTEYVDRVTAWIESQYPPLIGGTITVSHGPVSVTAAYDESATLRSQIHGLRRRVMVAVDGLNISPLPNQSGPNNASSEESHPVTGFVHEYQSGKHAYKVKGGPFEKFGVRVWPEVLVDAGLKPEDIPLGDHPATGDMIVEILNGKPRKVRRLNISLNTPEQQAIPF